MLRLCLSRLGEDAQESQKQLREGGEANGGTLDMEMGSVALAVN